MTVISSGTWTIAMKSGGDLTRLREDRDMLANVDVFGSPVATARFMGGREFELVAGLVPVAPTITDVNRLVAAGTMALPSFAEVGGPFQHRIGNIIGDWGLSLGERAALASVYIALVTDVLLDLLGDSDTIVVDGPFAKNAIYVGILKALRPHSTVSTSELISGAAGGALALVLGDTMPARTVPDHTVEALPVAGLVEYRNVWRSVVQQ